MDSFNPHKKVEQKETASISTEVLTPENFIDLVYKGKNFPQDDRFLPTKEGGVFRWLNLPDVLRHKDTYLYPIIKTDDLVVGVAGLFKSPYEKNLLGISFVSVDPMYIGKGYGSKLTEQIFKFAKKHGYIVETSAYSDDGWEKLKPLFNRYAHEFEVEFRDTERRHIVNP